jgi:phenylacetate-CoA ligase
MQLGFGQSCAALAKGHSWDGEQVAAFHRQRLTNLVRHCYARTPFYRALWKAAGIEPGDIRTIEDFRRLPIVTKTQLQDAGPKLISDNVPGSRLKLHRTSGSSGQPIEVRRTAFEDRLLQAIRVRRLMRMYGLRWTDRRTSVRVARPEWDPGFYARLGILRQQTFDCRLPAEQLAVRIVRSNPHTLQGYPCILADMAERIGGKLPNLRFAISGGDQLIETLRERIQAGLGKPLHEVYGAHECNLIALSCGLGARHVVEESVFLEVVRGDGSPAMAGEQGEAVITALHSFSAPIVRYRLGDLLVPGGPCDCGAAGRTIAQITGRVADLFERPDGSTYHPLAIVIPLEDIGRGLIRAFRVTQHSPGRMTILIEPLGEFPEHRIEQIRRSTQDAAGHPIDLDVRLAQNLTAEPNGKFRSFCRESPAAAS